MKISWTYTSIITANIFFIIFLNLILFYMKIKKYIFYKKEITLIVFSCLILVARILIPVEFPITYSIYMSNVYVEICRFLRNTKVCSVNIMIILFMISFCGTIIIAIIRILRYKRFIRLLSYGKTIRYIDTKNVFGQKIKIPIKKMKYINEIFIIGLLRPTIIFPEYLVKKENYVIQHELQHFKNHDLWYKLLLNILCTIYWWNPLVYKLRRSISDIMELRADFSVVEGISKKEKIEYVDSILLNAKEKRESRYGLGFSRNLYEIRIYSLLNDKRKQKLKFHIVVITMIILSFFIIIEPSGNLELGNAQFRLENSSSYLVKNQNGYDIFVDGKLRGHIKNIPKELSGLKVLEQSEIQIKK